MTQQTPMGIQFVFFDRVHDVPVTLGGAIFDSTEEAVREWTALTRFDGDTDFIADQLDAERDIIDDRPVSAETIQDRLGKPISILIEEGRMKNPDINPSALSEWLGKGGQ